LKIPGLGTDPNENNGGYNMGDGNKGAAGAASLAGMLWFAGWLFTISFANLVWWKIILGLVVWPLFLGVQLR
jgi:hypothetical protein